MNKNTIFKLSEMSNKLFNIVYILLRVQILLACILPIIGAIFFHKYYLEFITLYGIIMLFLNDYYYKLKNKLVRIKYLLKGLI